MILAHTLSPEVRAALATPHAIHASPTFVLCAPRRRGHFAERRATRTRRTDARRGSAPQDATPDLGACLQAFANAWSASTRG